MSRTLTLIALLASLVAAGARSTYAQVPFSPSAVPRSLSSPSPARPSNAAIVRVMVAEQNAVSQGSGTLVGVGQQHGLVITNWHVVRDAAGDIVVEFPDGFRSAASVIKTDPDWDLAALLIWKPQAQPISIARQAPRPGQVLTIAGYGSGAFRAVSGRCTQYVAPGMEFPYEMVELSAEARQGDSGGPILNDRGELAGVLFGASNGTTSGSYCGRVLWFLESVWPRVEPTQPFNVASTGVPSEPAPIARVESDAVQETATAAEIARSGESHWSGVQRGTPRFHATPIVSANNSPLDVGDPVVPWQDLVGATPFEKAKTLMAGIGILAVLLQFGGMFKRQKPATDEEEDEEE